MFKKKEFNNYNFKMWVDENSFFNKNLIGIDI